MHKMESQKEIDDVDEERFCSSWTGAEMHKCMLVKLARIIFYPELCSPNERMAYDSLRPLDTFILSWTAFWHELYFQSPSTIGEERQYNPFLRSHSAELHLALGLQQFQDEDWTQFRARVLEELRKRKDLYNRR